MLTKSLRFGTLLASHRPQSARVSEPPLRAELFGVEQLARHAEALAAKHQIATARGPNRLLARLDHNEEILRAFNRATLAVDKSRRVTPAAEWLLDNFYLIEEQIQMARRHLPREYSRELPRLTSGPSAGLPRVYDIVLELISHVDAQIDAALAHRLRRRVSDGVSVLKLGELWAIPIMLRLGLIENLQRVTTRLASARHDRDLARRLGGSVAGHGGEKSVPSRHRGGGHGRSPISPCPVRLSRNSASASRAKTQCCISRAAGSNSGSLEQGLSIEQLVHQESQSQAADQVSVSHSIASLRFLSAMDWKEFVETLSMVEHTLRSDPADVYGDMDFATRDRYRHAVESLARHSQLSETEVAQKAIQLAQESARQKGRDDRTAHVGFYLIDKGRPALERAVTCAGRWKTIVERSIRRFPLTFYAGGIFLLTLLGTFGFHAAGPDARCAGMEAGFLHADLSPGCQPTGRGVDELALHAPG